jgi:hypothetical protein
LPASTGVGFLATEEGKIYVLAFGVVSAGCFCTETVGGCYRQAVKKKIVCC